MATDFQEDHLGRSNFIRQAVQGKNNEQVASAFRAEIPKQIVQFWDDLNQLPEDVNECISSWQKVRAYGIKTDLFDTARTRHFILEKLGSRYAEAFDKCYHPAMQSDYFRLCYIYAQGGCYVDADDVYNGAPIDHLFSNGKLKLQPLCYDISTRKMVPVSIFTNEGANSPGWIFYFNNNPLIASSGHPLIKLALHQATIQLEQSSLLTLPEIQSTAGPGNLSKAIFEAGKDNLKIDEMVDVLFDWENIATSNWNLNYRNDSRNWRLCNGQRYTPRNQNTLS